jgi:hypothetical protein
MAIRPLDSPITEKPAHLVIAVLADEPLLGGVVGVARSLVLRDGLRPLAAEVALGALERLLSAVSAKGERWGLIILRYNASNG